MREALPPYPKDAIQLARFRNDRRPFFDVEQDSPLAVVLGCGTPLLPDVNVTACQAEGVPLYRRKGGGGAVVLGRGVMVVSACLPPVPGRFPDAWSQRIIEVLRASLAAAGAPGVLAKGLGDLCLPPEGGLSERKFLGSSLYLARDVVLYQASLLYRADLSLIPRYLGPPSRQPDYRRGRSHLDFVANLAPAWRLDTAFLVAELNSRLDALLSP